MSSVRLEDSIGRQEERLDFAAVAPLRGLAALLDHSDSAWRAGEAPPLGHWLYFLPRAPQSEIGEDGHPRRGDFLPPVALPRRMWAGGRLTFHVPIRIGEAIRRRSSIAGVEAKTGRSGELVFVKVLHEISTNAGLAVSEEQEIVYRAAPQPGEASPPARPAPPDMSWSRAVDVDSVLLFRYSALTFNGHRIHYDRDYCRDVENYPGLVVHGPLSATLMVDLFLCHHPGARIRSFRFRAHRPLFDTNPFTVAGLARPNGAAMWIADHEGHMAMSAELEA
jgi:3-methylfumaryl-CoA hydratase